MKKNGGEEGNEGISESRWKNGGTVCRSGGRCLIILGAKTGQKNSLENLPEKRAAPGDPTSGSEPSWWWRLVGGWGEWENSKSVHVGGIQLAAAADERECRQMIV